MRCLALFSIFALFFHHQVYAFEIAKKWGHRKIAIVIGGGGESRMFSSTIFDDDYAKLSRVLKYRGYETYVVFGGAHQKLNEISARFHTRRWTATQENFDKLTDIITLQLSKGEIKKGDQIAIFVVGHGYNRDAGSNRKAHRIAFYSEDLKSDASFELDQLRRIITFAEDKDVKVGLVDTSCYSGYSLELSSEKTCVLTSSTQKTLGYLNFLDEITNLPYFDLEQIYLLSRKHVLTSQPEISTDAHKSARQKLWFIENYLMFNLWRINALYFRNPWEPCYCEEDYLKGFILDTTEKQIAANPTKKYIDNFANWKLFRDLATSIQIKIHHTILLQKQIPRLPKVNTLIGDQKLELTNHAMYYFVRMQSTLMQDQFNRILKKSNIKAKPQEFWSFIDGQRGAILIENDYKNYVRYQELQKELEQDFYKLNALERKVYEEIYRKEQKPNACSSFEF